MCKFLSVSRSLFYYKSIEKTLNTEVENHIIDIFKKSKNNYGTRKIQKELVKLEYAVSRRKISDIMKKYALISNYTVKKFVVKKSTPNEDNDPNILEQKFNNKEELEVVVSDLTYVNVGGKWNYVCLLIDLYNREIIGYSAGKNKNAQLVKEAFLKVEIPLKNIKIFHTDRGSEFKNGLIEEMLKTFSIKRSLSKKGNPYDNAVAEAMYKVFKTEFIWNQAFQTLDELQLKLFEYVNWYNNIRIHGSLGYKSPVEYREDNKKSELYL